MDLEHTHFCRLGLGKNSRWRPVPCPALLMMALFVMGSVAARGQTSFQPDSAAGQIWQITSLLEDARLQDRLIFNVDFDTEGNAWLATSDGLHFYDGYYWTRYSEANGLPSNFVRYVLVARDGSVWIGTDQGAATFDGETFSLFADNARLAGPNIRRIVEDTDGTLWFCSDTWLRADVSAGLTAWRVGEVKIYRQGDGLPTDYVSDYFRDSQERQWVLTSDGLALKQGEGWVRPLEKLRLAGYDQYFWNIAESPSAGLVATTHKAIFVLKDDRWTRLEHQDSYEHPNPKIAATTRGEIVSYGGLRDQQFLAWTGSEFQAISTGTATGGGVEFLKEAPDGSIWCVGYKSILRWQRSGGEWIQYHNLPPPRLVDHEGNIWFVDNESAVRYGGGKWETVPGVHGRAARDQSGGIWIWSKEGVRRLSKNGAHDFSEREMGLGPNRRFQLDAKGNVWFIGKDGQSRNVATVFDGSQWTALKPPELQGAQILQSLPDRISGVWHLLSRGPRTDFWLVKVDENGGIEVLPSVVRNVERAAFILDAANTIWFFGEFGLLRRAGERWQRVGLPGRLVREAAWRQGEVWFFYRGHYGGRSGVSRYTADDWTHFEVPPGRLLANNGNETVFSGANNSLYLISDLSGKQPSVLSAPFPTTLTGGVLDLNDNLWLAGDDYVLRYRPDGVPPETELFASEKEVLRDHSLLVQLTGLERFKPRNQTAFQFSWRFDDGDWSAFTTAPDSGLTIAGLGTGHHVLEVRARDEGFDVDPTPARIVFQVHAIPLQERTWFRWAVGGVLTVVLCLAGAAVASRRKLALRSHDLVQSNTALRESEARFRALFEQAAVGVAQIETQTGRFVRINKKYCDIVGYSAQEMAELTFQRITHPDDLQEELDSMRQLQACQTSEFSMEKRYFRKDGSVVWVKLAVSTLWREREEPDYHIEVVEEITARKHAEEALQEANRELERRVDDRTTELSRSNQRLTQQIAERIQAQEALRESQKRLQLVTDNVPGLIAYVDAQQRYRFVNPAYERWFGRSHAEILGKHVRQILGQAAYKNYRERIERALAGETVAFENWFMTRGGEEKYVGGIYAPHLEADEVLGFFVLVMDMTERKKAEDEIKHLSLQNELILSAAGEGIYGLDTEGRTTFINPAGAKMIGWEAAELIGKMQHDVLHHSKPDGSPYRREECPIYQAFKDGAIHNVTDEVFWRKDGSSFPVEYVSTPIRGEDGQPIGAVVVFKDITEQKQAQEALRRSEEQYRRLVQSSPYCIHEIDLEGRLISMNRAGLEMMGIEKEKEVVDTPYLSAVCPEDRARVGRLLERARRGDRSEFDFQAVNGRTFHSSFVPIEDRAGEVARLMGITQDITDRRKAEEEIHILNEELEERVKQRTAELQFANRELEAFAFSVSHDLRAPLRAISGFAEIVAGRHRDSLNEEGRHYFDNIVQAGAQMTRLIDDLLYYSRMGRKAVKRQPVPLNDLLGAISKQFANRAADAGAKMLIASGLPIVRGDARLLRQIFGNLIDNALAYQKPDVPTVVQVGAEIEDGHVKVRVVDNGIGIPPKYHDKIFNLFQRLHSQEKYPGTGIGLALVKKAVELQEGGIRVESRAGQGSTFVVRLPIHKRNRNGDDG